MNGLDLFSGIGGLSLALSPWVRTIAYCERDRYAQAVLLSRMAEGTLHAAPIWDDVQTLTREMLPAIDVILGGFPCQDISAAGRGAGLDGKRSGLFYEIARLVGEIRPSFVFLENVPAIRTRGLIDVVRTLANLGYDSRWTCVSAADVGAPHLRKRWFLLAANADGIGLRDWRERSQERETTADHVSANDGSKEHVAHASGIGWREGRPESTRLEGRLESSSSSSSVADAVRARRTGARPERSEEADGARSLSESSRSGWWTVEPNVGRVANGVPFRVDRIRCLGNAVVPSQAREAFQRLIGLEECIT